ISLVMPCNIDTIVRIKVVRETEKDNQLTVWAIGCYPVGNKDKEIELTLFVPVDFEERDHDLQAIFQKDEYFSAGDKIIPNKYKDTIRPRLKFIDNVMYIYAQDINWVDTQFNIKKREYEIINEDMLTNGNTNSLNVNDELVNNEVNNDLNNIEQNNKDGNQKNIHNTRKSSSFKTNIVNNESE
ncbi:15159_t:CDS:2, partial [Gigaspora rosea]